MSRPFTRPGTAQPHPIQSQKNFKILNEITLEEFEQLKKKTESIKTISIDEILNLYTVKCQDSKVKYKPEQAVKFIERCKKNLYKRKMNFSDQGLGIEFAKVLT